MQFSSNSHSHSCSHSCSQISPTLANPTDGSFQTQHTSLSCESVLGSISEAASPTVSRDLATSSKLLEASIDGLSALQQQHQDEIR
mmetsp:Transcript_34828/g.48480  ORF Transcript_34828/g.48480 Transcript_34828/m.48480 type:complete len:86 (+) Transcript_34828:520-777(+)